MFPNKLVEQLVPTNYRYPNLLPLKGNISEAQIHRHLTKLSPHKATGPDEIPNVVLKECASVLMPYLLHIFCVMFKLQTYFRQCREIITCMLWKPGKPSYNLPKAYRPIALLNFIVKLATSIVTEELSHLVEAHGLLPATHF